MPDIAIRIKNLPQIRHAFGLAPQLMTRELNLAIKKTVFNISRDSRRFTPVDTGRLRSSTYERFSNLRGEVGTRTDYDVFVHQGTRYMQARPYLLKSVQKNDFDTQRFFTLAVQSVLTKIGRMT